MNDDFLDRLQADWRSQHTDVDQVLRRLRRNRWTPHIVLGAEILGCALTFLVGLWFAWIAVHDEQHRMLFTISAAALLLAVPLLCVASVMARRDSLAWDVESPESVLNVSLRRAESSLRAIRIGRWHVAILAAFVVTLWAAEALGFIDAIDFLILYTTVCAFVSVVSWVWMNRREGRVRREQAACNRLLAALRVDQGSH
jgi:hypothetical protein